MRRRSLLKTGLAAGTLMITGCSTVARKNLSVSNSSYDTVRGLSRPTKPSIPSQFRGIELYGQIQLDTETPVCLVPVQPVEDSHHYILEYNVSVKDPSYFSSGDPELDVRLIPKARIESFLNEAEDEQNCVETLGKCRNSNELEEFDLELSFEPGVKVGEKPRYKRIELCSDQYYLTFDSTEVWHKLGNPSNSGPEITPYTANVALRTFSTRMFDREDSTNRISQFAQQFNRADRDTVSVIKEFQDIAGRICELSQAQQVADNTVNDITSADFEIQALSKAGEHIAEYINQNYSINFPINDINRLNTIISFGASTLPLAGAIYRICATSCQLDAKKIPQNPTSRKLNELKEISRKFGMGILFFVIDIILLWSGIGGKIAKTAVQTVDELMLRYLSRFVGHDLYFKLLEWVYLIVEAEISLREFIETKTSHYAHPDEEQSILDRLDGIDEDGISGWRQIDSLLEKGCQKVTANVSGGIPPLQSSQQL